MHELVHAVDDLNDWYLDGISLNTRPSEALAYGTERLLDALKGSLSLPSMEHKFTSAQAAQAAWNAAWSKIEYTIGTQIQYYLIPFDRTGTLVAGDFNDISIHMGLTLSSSALNPLYDVFVMKNHLPAGSISNNFSFTQSLCFS